MKKPIFCDLSCPFAAWPKELSDGSRSCRTFIGLQCNVLDTIVPKNGRCRVSEQNWFQAIENNNLNINNENKQ